MNALPRSTVWSQKQTAAGLCSSCGKRCNQKPKHPGKFYSLCPRHHKKQLARMRQRQGYQARRPKRPRRIR